MATEAAKAYKEDAKGQQLKLNYTNSLHEEKGEDYMKNVRKREDGRYEWRKQIKLIKYDIIDKNKKKLETKVRNILKTITLGIVKAAPKTFYELAEDWYNTYKKDLKSGNKYKGYMENRFKINIFNQPIDKITFDQLEHFITSIKEHRVASYCYFIITGVYQNALKRDLIKKDISKFITKPKNKTVKGKWFNIKEQKLILDNLDKTPIKNEILFYLMTGCRRAEAINVKIEDIDFEKCSIHIKGTKTKSAIRYVPISKSYSLALQENFKDMFNFQDDYYTKGFKDFLDMLGIKNKKLHDLRHTFSTNLYYLGVPDKERQYYLGHSSIVITNDIYTDLDPNVTKQDILNLYKDLYPKF